MQLGSIMIAFALGVLLSDPLKQAWLLLVHRLTNDRPHPLSN